MLEGKAKELFEQWYFKNYVATRDQDINDILDEQFYIDSFYQYPQALQWGVIQDFADSLGYHMETVLEEWGFDGSETIHVTSFRISHLEFEGFDTRHQARTAAIEKLNELINKGL